MKRGRPIEDGEYPLDYIRAFLPSTATFTRLDHTYACNHVSDVVQVTYAGFGSAILEVTPAGTWGTLYKLKLHTLTSPLVTFLSENGILYDTEGRAYTFQNEGAYCVYSTANQAEWNHFLLKLLDMTSHWQTLASPHMPRSARPRFYTGAFQP
jgi:hypothetical protein